MINRFVLVLAALAMLTTPVLVACGGGGADTEAPATEETTEEAPAEGEEGEATEEAPAEGEEGEATEEEAPAEGE
ncbi:hypothetical protein PN462_15465 [Spirulina sp. CS-785/01]|uniref:hypothetical protein n=1 Tax=Spirulina sp. CS-785/01 TaxID=3021716 RepID=UPI00232CF118|nr:hypothetical protein [Spirulina sp. CS-785/01]MDB9314510.1 hypothetical protein [Spirulina sp. CS-785/01]